MQPYRSDLEALEARHAALEAEVNDRVRQRDEAARMLEEVRARQRAADLAADFARGEPGRRRRRTLVMMLTGLAVVAAFIGMARVRSKENERERFYARVMVQFEKFTNDACACTTSECITALNERMSKWGSEITREMDMYEPQQPDESAMKRAQELGERMGACMTKAMATPTPYAAQEGAAERL